MLLGKRGRLAGNNKNREEEGRYEQGCRGRDAGGSGILCRCWGIAGGSSGNPNMGLLIPRNNGNCPMQNGDG